MGDLIPITEAPSFDVDKAYTLADDPEEQRVIAEQEAEARDAVVVVDKRGKNNPSAQRRKIERARVAEVKRQQKAAQETWAKQAAGTMWWMAQGQGQRGNAKLAEHTLRKREELISGARAQGLAV